MSQRYSLRFESGERRGEVIPIAGSVFTVGRRPGNSLQIVENSVSGHHAELHIDRQGVLLRDVGSTNGTRVETERVLEVRLRPGVRVTFGNITLRFTDAEAPDAGLAAAASEAPIQIEPVVGGDRDVTVELGGGTHTVSREALARSAKRSKVGPLLLVGLAAAGGGAWWWTKQGGGVSRGEATRAVPVVADNLLAAGFSFEGEDSPWEPREDSASAFVRNTRSRYSGEKGLGVTLEAGEDAVHVSPVVDVRTGAQLQAVAEVRAPGTSLARLGIELSSSDASEDAPGSVVVWSTGHAEVNTFQTVSLEAAVPPGYDRARVLVSADASGTRAGRVDVDDVRLVPTGAGGPVAVVDEYQLFQIANTLNLFQVDRTLLSGLSLHEADESPLDTTELRVVDQLNGVRLEPVTADAIVLSVLAEPVVAGIATMGSEGYTQRTEDFEADSVTDLLFGRGLKLVRISFGEGVPVRGRRDGAGLRMVAALPSGTTPLIQLRFQAEREATVNLSADARLAEERGDLGECLRLWQQLLDEYPFDEAEVARAEEVRARLTRLGFEETRKLASEVERAKFFRLVDIYRECRAGAVDLARRYAGSEVETGAGDLLARIDEDLAVLEADLDKHEVGRLRSILAVLELQESPELAKEVRTYLVEEYGQDPETTKPATGEPGEGND